jgi:hypothetical protein
MSARCGDAMAPRRDDDAKAENESETRISHFIPSVELKGSRDEKLEKLDTLIRYLEHLRHRLAGDAAATLASDGRPSPFAARPAWPWFAAGVLASALFLLLAVAARSCA